MKRLLRSRKGETLAETLCAVLVAGVAIALLAGLMEAASRLDRKTAKATADLYTAADEAEEALTGTNGTITVKVGDQEKTLSVTFYGKEDQAASYRGRGGNTP